MKERQNYILHLTDDDINNIKVACNFIKNAFVTHLRHTADHDSVMSVVGTLGYMIEELDVQMEFYDHDKIFEQVNKLLKQIEDDH